jgi:hypothetical protein
MFVALKNIYRSKMNAKIFCIVFTIIIASALVVAQQAEMFPRLSVGAFGELGHQQGLAGGGSFSGTTFSVNALSGEAPMVVATDDGKSALSVRSWGEVVIDGDLTVYGNKQFAENHPTDPDKIISYISLEGAEAGIYTRGTAQIIDGETTIDLPEHFSLLASDGNLTVMLTPLGNWLELYVTEKSPERIVVHEASGKSGEFDYLVQGIRKGHENFQPISLRK